MSIFRKKPFRKRAYSNYNTPAPIVNRPRTKTRKLIFAVWPPKTHRAALDIPRPAFHGRSHAVGTEISRRVGQRVQGPQGSWSIQVKLGPIQGEPLVAALRAAKPTFNATKTKFRGQKNRRFPFYLLKKCRNGLFFQHRLHFQHRDLRFRIEDPPRHHLLIEGQKRNPLDV